MAHQSQFGPPKLHGADPQAHLMGPPPHQTPSQPKPVSRPKPVTQPVTCGAVFCCVSWLVIILATFLVLVIFVIYRPQNPKFKISNASLNAAYLGMSIILDVDLTILANFSNPNSKANVEFGYVTLHLYFNQQLIANQYIQPFSIVNSESKLAYAELVAKQVRLPSQVNQQFINQVQRNRIMFVVNAVFHAKPNFERRYSNWLYCKCVIEMTGPPAGVLIASKRRTKN